MDLTDIDNLKNFLSRFRIRPSDKLGQNFLISQPVLEKILAAAELNADDTVVEIGPGIGTLTLRLALSAGRVFAVEKDPGLIPPLRSLLKKNSNVQIVNQDFLKVNVPQLLTAGYSPPNGFKVVANIPYYITGKILGALLALPQKPKIIVLLVQKEVGERICASAGKMSVLSLSVQFYGRPELLGAVSAAAFYPKPKVDSVILKITPFSAPSFSADPKRFFRLVKIGFASRRKTLENNLSAGLGISKGAAAKFLKASGLGPKARAQELNLKDWERLLKIVEAGLEP